MIYLSGLYLYFNNKVDFIEDKEQDVFKNMLEMTLTSKNQVLKECVSKIFKRNIMESGGCNLGVSNNHMDDISEYSSMKSSDIKYDKNFIRRGFACYMRNIRGEEEDCHFIRI